METLSKMFRSLMEASFLETRLPLYGHVGQWVLSIRLTKALSNYNPLVIWGSAGLAG